MTFNGPIYSFTTKFRHPKEGHFNSHCVKPPLSTQRSHQMNGWVAHTSQRLFGFKHETKGEYKVFRIGGVLPKEKTLEWKLRMKVGFHHKFVVNE
jgi:hypothetical protein